MCGNFEVSICSNVLSSTVVSVVNLHFVYMIARGSSLNTSYRFLFLQSNTHFHSFGGFVTISSLMYIFFLSFSFVGEGGGYLLSNIYGIWINFVILFCVIKSLSQLFWPCFCLCFSLFYCLVRKAVCLINREQKKNCFEPLHLSRFKRWVKEKPVLFCHLFKIFRFLTSVEDNVQCFTTTTTMCPAVCNSDVGLLLLA